MTIDDLRVGSMYRDKDGDDWIYRGKLGEDCVFEHYAFFPTGSLIRCLPSETMEMFGIDEYKVGETYEAKTGELYVYEGKTKKGWLRFVEWGVDGEGEAEIVSVLLVKPSVAGSKFVK
jgi:hypothetical protein